MYLEKVLSQKNLGEKKFGWHLEGHWPKEQDPEPDLGSVSQSYGSEDPGPDL
jgi:hypothetical protein